MSKVHLVVLVVAIESAEEMVVWNMGTLCDVDVHRQFQLDFNGFCSL